MQVNDHYAPNISKKAIEYKIVTAQFQSHYAKMISLYFFYFIILFILHFKYKILFKKIIRIFLLIIYVFFTIYSILFCLLLFYYYLLRIYN